LSTDVTILPLVQKDGHGTTQNDRFLRALASRETDKPAHRLAAVRPGDTCRTGLGATRRQNWHFMTSAQRRTSRAKLLFSRWNDIRWTLRHLLKHPHPDAVG
jgi:hypothetical protein